MYFRGIIFLVLNLNTMVEIVYQPICQTGSAVPTIAREIKLTEAIKIFEWTEMELRCIIQSYESIYM